MKDLNEPMNLKNAKRWVMDIFYWIAEGKAVVMGLLSVVAAFLLGFYTWSTEDSIRIVGYFLQLIGMLLAIGGLLEIREYFELPTLSSLFVDWIKRFPKWRKTIISNLNIVEESNDAVAIFASKWSPDDPKEPLENRIHRILQNIEQMRDIQVKHSLTLADLDREQTTLIKKITVENVKLKEEFQFDLRSLHTSGFLDSLIGLILLSIGMTLSTLAPELYELLIYLTSIVN